MCLDYCCAVSVTLRYTSPDLHYITVYCVTLHYTICSPHSNLDNPNGGCVFMPQWQAYSCKNLQHHMFVIESMDPDTETRRLSPIALDGGNTGNGDYTDLLNGPMDHGERANLDIPISDKHEPHLVTRTSLHHTHTPSHPTPTHTSSHSHTPHPHTLTPSHPLPSQVGALTTLVSSVSPHSSPWLPWEQTTVCG